MPEKKTSSDPNESQQIPAYFLRFYAKIERKLDLHAESQRDSFSAFKNEIRTFLFNDQQPKNGLAYRFDMVESLLEQHLKEHDKEKDPGNRSERAQTWIMVVTLLLSTGMSGAAIVISLVA